MSTATFIERNTTRQGNWIGFYGSDGYYIHSFAPSLPAYVTSLTPTGTSSFTWADPAFIAKAIQKPGGSGRIETAWYTGTNMTFPIVLTSGTTLSVYCEDPDNFGRDITVQILDSNGVTVLDSRVTGTTAGLASEINNGVWFRWRISGGNVTVKVIFGPSVGSNAVLTAFMFDPLAPAAATTLRKKHAFSKTHDTIAVAWPDSSPVVPMELQRSLAGQNSWSVIGTTSPYIDTGLAKETEYDYRVKFNDASFPASNIYSNTLTVKTRLASPPIAAPDRQVRAPYAWYIADRITGKVNGNSVTQWDDVSGNSRHLTGTCTYNTAAFGRPCLRFNGTSDLLKRTGMALSQPFTIIDVITTDELRDSDGLFGGDTAGDWSLMTKTTGLLVDTITFGDLHFPTDSDDKANSGSILYGPYLRPTIITGLAKSSGDTCYRAWINGCFVPQWGAGSTFGSAGITNFQLGKSRATAGTFHKGYRFETIVFNYQLSPLELQWWHDYLSAKYNTFAVDVARQSMTSKQFLLFSFGPDERLYVAESVDGVTFDELHRVRGYVGIPVRDPMPIVRNGIIYVAHSYTSLGDMPGSSYGNYISIAKSIDRGTSFQPHGKWDLSSIYSTLSNNNTWAPDWLVDTDGKVYIAATVNDGDGAGFGYRIAEVTSFEPFTTGAIQTISGVTGIDIGMIKRGSTYCASQFEGKFLTSSSLLGPYTQVGQITVSGEDGSVIEGPQFREMGNNILRCYYWNINNVADSGLWYRESSDNGLTWGARVYCPTKGIVSAHGGLVDASTTLIGSGERISVF